MRRLIVCCDGTWNTAEDETVTNVRRLANAVGDHDEDGNQQLAYYQPGVGTDGNLLSRLLGAGTGAGLSRNVLDAYHWLVTRYEPGDRVALFGFSRGAYTARSLAGMISACGLIETAHMTEAAVWRQIQRLYDQRYRRRDGTGRWREGLDFLFDPDRPEEIPVDFIGVWDTVGALGIPDYLGWLDMLEVLPREQFHDVTLNPHIRHGRHAIAMDENRGPYAPTLWSEPYGLGQDVAQMWFPGSHGDVGGGHAQKGLADGALRWMIDEARATVRLGFNPATIEQVKPDPLDVMHDGFAIGGRLEPALEPSVKPVLEMALHPQPRAVPRIDPYARDHRVHPSVFDRCLNPPITGGRYRATHVLEAGQSATVDVYAHRPWNETGLYLEPGDYVFSAAGEWRDANIPSGPDGTTGLDLFNPLVERTRLVGTITGQVEALYRRLSGNSAADFAGARRDGDLPWMSLVGVVANNAARRRNGHRQGHERVAIGTDAQHYVTRGGYLYTYANDAWGRYLDNQGSVRLTVSRLSTEEHGPRRRGRARRAATT
jgi:hypothetical protein